MPKLKTLSFAVSVFIMLVFAISWLTRFNYSWTDWKPATCMPEACFCEAQRPGTVAQPANTWSSLGFVLVGLLILSGRIATRVTSNFSMAHTAVYSCALIFTGLGSTFYHASLTFVGQFFDVMGMYLLGVFILLYNLAQIRPLRAQRFVGSYVALNFVLAMLLIILPELRRYLFGVLIVLALFWAYHPQRAASAPTARKFLAAAVATLLLAFFSFLLDLTRVWCVPESWLQGHALWHLGGALSAWLLYQYYTHLTHEQKLS